MQTVQKSVDDRAREQVQAPDGREDLRIEEPGAGERFARR